MADPDAKLNSLFGKKKKKKSTTVNANVIVKTSAQNIERATAERMAAAASAKPAPKVVAPATVASGKILSDLLLNKEEEQTKMSFQWAKQPKKYRKPSEKESVATTWAEQEQRNRVNRRIQLDNERAFPSLGIGASKVQLQSMKAPITKAVETKNAWASLHDDEDEE